MIYPTMTRTLETAISEEQARLIRSAAARHGMENPRLFGSRVTGESRAESDFDLLVRVGRGRGFHDFVEFCEELERGLGRHVDVIPEDGLSPFLRERVLAEAVPV